MKTQMKLTWNLAAEVMGLNKGGDDREANRWSVDGGYMYEI